MATPRLRGRKAVKQRERRLKRSDGLCEDCLAVGRVALATEVDHIIPLDHDGPDTDDNTRNLCHECHVKRTAEQFGHKPAIALDGWPLET